MKYPKNCWGCVSCVKECKAGAIDFFLGADIGGNGSIMNVKSEGDILHWIITKTDGSTSVIDVTDEIRINTRRQVLPVLAAKTGG